MQFYRMHKVCVIPGDGIGPEVMRSALEVLGAITDELSFIETQIGVEAYRKHGKYLTEETIQIIKNTDACLFGAITTPSDPAYRSPLLALRQGLKLYANVRPIVQFLPEKQKLDMVIIRENTEDLYVGLEQEHGNYAVAAKIVSDGACEKIVDFAIRYANEHGRKKITCVHKANVLRKTDGRFVRVFRERMANVDIEAEDMYVDTCALKMVTEPWRFDVVLTLNLYGDILSDLGAGLIGGLGFAPSANLGDNYAIFEPVHGSAPDIAGRDAANPTAMLLSACMMLDYLGMHEKAEMLRNAIVELYRRGVRTKDVGGNVGTAEFTRMVVEQVKSYL